ncbi:Rrp15p-domain-containing protein [Podospora aff. communis PSN243]|uniref:Rrp15p-domain-containing protein n=1 Tax=Podospora aff. communis PSN243 TaxID=3040156 RepID=A0AAV9GXQ0_9PEZI|nr:Rrp15p-domain-containing protein [Podospora aff. communis PSN243]
MAGTALKKRAFSDGPKGRAARPTKKQRQVAAYHSSSSEDEQEDDVDAPLPPNLLDSDDDEDLDNIEVDDGASTDSHADSDSDSDAESQPRTKAPSKPKKQQKEFVAKDAPDSSEDDFSGDERDSFSDVGSHSGSDGGHPGARDTRSKRNDPEAMQTAMMKILASKTPASRRADPIVARSIDAAKAAKQVVDAALETKARKRLREQKRLAKEKGRVRDVLVASTTRSLNIATGEIEEKLDDDAETTGQILATERRLRKVAQRGVVKLFNAVRAAQVKAAEAERVVKKEGVVGAKRKEEKVTEMSKKGFLDLIASGGGGLKKGGLEEA